MPELPDLAVYLHALAERIAGRRLERLTLAQPFVLRTVEPPIESLAGRRVISLHRLGKRLVIGFEGDLHLLVHLMIAGRLRWKSAGAKAPGRITLAVFEFETGTLVLTEAGSKRRAALHLVEGEAGLRDFATGGLEVLDADLPAFREAIIRENHTLKRALTDPRLFSGIGNAYSDEILHRARLSPFKLSRHLTADETERLFLAARATLEEWTARLLREAGDRFPEVVTAFRPEMAVHGRYRQPCPVCGAHVQRIVYAENEANYCPGCQTEGQILADRALSRLLKKEWPRTVEELEKLGGRCP